jgi:putative ABC transport system substrate-binding protein
MNRKLWLLAVLLLTSFNLAQAQQPKVYRAGVLGPPGRLDQRLAIKGLLDGLKEAGYVEGQNLLLNTPNVKTYDELRLIAKGYVQKKVDIIITHGGTATGIAKEATKEIPIVFITGISDPVQQVTQGQIFTYDISFISIPLTALLSAGCSSIRRRNLVSSRLTAV